MMKLVKILLSLLTVLVGLAALGGVVWLARITDWVVLLLIYAVIFLASVVFWRIKSWEPSRKLENRETT